MSIIHRNQANGPSISTRKVIGVEKSEYSKKNLTEAQPDHAPMIEEAKIEVPKEVEVEVQQENKRASKRSEFAALERERKSASDQKEALRKAKELSDAIDAKDIDRIAKANGMSVTDYVTFVNRAALGQKTTTTLSPEEAVRKSAQEWQTRTEQELFNLKKEVNETKALNYMNKNIIPHIVKDPDKYEFLIDKDIDEQAYIVYEFMNRHFIETGGINGGEELDPVELLDALEDKYLNEWKETEKMRAEKAAKFKKLKEKQIEPESKPENKMEGISKSIPAAKSVSHPSSDADKLAGMLSGDGVDEDALAKSAPSNLIGGPSRGSAGSVARQPSFQTGGTTPKNSKYSREARLAAMSKSRE